MIFLNQVNYLYLLRNLPFVKKHYEKCSKNENMEDKDSQSVPLQNDEIAVAIDVDNEEPDLNTPPPSKKFKPQNSLLNFVVKTSKHDKETMDEKCARFIYAIANIPIYLSG